MKKNKLPIEINSKSIKKLFSVYPISSDGMKEITEEDYKKFIREHDFVVIENVKVPLLKNHKIEKFEPENFKLETTTVWSFPERGE
jgi:hypothetical protein